MRRVGKGGQGQLSALIALSGSKQGTCRVVMYRDWKGWAVVWRGASRPLCYVQAPSAFSDSHTI